MFVASASQAKTAAYIAFRIQNAHPPSLLHNVAVSENCI